MLITTSCSSNCSDSPHRRHYLSC